MKKSYQKPEMSVTSKNECQALFYHIEDRTCSIGEFHDKAVPENKDKYDMEKTGRSDLVSDK